jgi:hypothetical protein
MILSLLKGATMELAHEDDIENRNVAVVELEPGGLLVLAGEARYNWRHRVLPSCVADGSGDDAGSGDAGSGDAAGSDVGGRDRGGNVQRMSIVLGAMPSSGGGRQGWYSGEGRQGWYSGGGRQG